MEYTKRWYDQYPRLSACFETYKEIKSGPRNRIAHKILALIYKKEPEIMDKYVLEFPLDESKRRWYDKNPYMWLIVNSLKYASPELLNEITLLLEKEISLICIAVPVVELEETAK